MMVCGDCGSGGGGGDGGGGWDLGTKGVDSKGMCGYFLFIIYLFVCLV